MISERTINQRGKIVAKDKTAKADTKASAKAAEKAARPASQAAAKAAAEAASKDYTGYPGKAASDLQVRFAAWTKDKCGLTFATKKEEAAYDLGLKLGVALRIEFQASPENQAARAAAAAAPKPVKEVKEKTPKTAKPKAEAAPVEEPEADSADEADEALVEAEPEAAPVVEEKPVPKPPKGKAAATRPAKAAGKATGAKAPF